MDEAGELRRQLAAAQATVADQAVEINRLQRDAQARSGLEALREVLELSDVVAATVGQAPYRQLLAGIVHAAQRLFDAGAASIATLDGESNELVFEASSGGGEVVGRRIPAHQGIAGWVVMTGEPIAVADVRRDPRWARDFAESTGYTPESIMAVPLIVGEDVEGVLEVLDKRTASSFGLNDIEMLGLFARPAAVALEQARTVTQVGEMLLREIGRLAGERGDEDLDRMVQAALSSHSTTPEQTLELARLVHAVSRRGDRARRLAVEVLGSVSRYLA